MALWQANSGKVLGEAVAACRGDGYPWIALNYDQNGNRESGGHETGANNRLLTDGTYNYEYDNEGNRTKRTNISTGDYTIYVWDHRNRLVEVLDYDSSDDLTQEVDYAYDASNHLTKRVVDPDGELGSDPIEQTVYAWQHGQIVYQFNKTGSGALGLSDLSHRYLWGPAVDMLLADEQVDWSDSDADGEVLWALTDHLGTVRDIIDNEGDVLDHAEYDAFGNRLNAAAVDVVFGYTGKLFDDATGLQNNWNRWYDPAVGRWASEDPIKDGTNWNAYVGNKTTMYVDPDGLVERPYRSYRQKGYVEGVGDVFLGYGDAAVGTAKGIWFMVRHPIQTVKGVGTAILHPIRTGQAICADAYEKSGTVRGQGEMAGDVLIGIATGGAIKTASKTGQVAKLTSKLDNVIPDDVPSKPPGGTAGTPVAPLPAPTPVTPPSRRPGYWWPGRYQTPASQHGAYANSGRRVFPTQRNSGLSGPSLRLAQEEFTKMKLCEGHPMEVIIGQAHEAGLKVHTRPDGTRFIAQASARNAVNRAKGWFDSWEEWYANPRPFERVPSNDSLLHSQ